MRTGPLRKWLRTTRLTVATCSLAIFSAPARCQGRTPSRPDRCSNSARAAKSRFNWPTARRARSWRTATASSYVVIASAMARAVSDSANAEAPFYRHVVIADLDLRSNTQETRSNGYHHHGVSAGRHWARPRRRSVHDVAEVRRLHGRNGHRP